MVYINNNRFSFSAFKLLLILINMSLYLEDNVVRAAALSNLDINSGTSEGACKRNCTTQACLEFEDELAKYMNPAVDPCDDFYEFACGNFKNQYPSVDRVDTFSYMTEISGQQIIRELTDGIKESDSKSIRKLKIYFQNCMNKTRIEEEGEQLLLEKLHNIGGWPVLLGDKWNEIDYDLMNTVYKIIDENVSLYFPITLKSRETFYKLKILSIGEPLTTVNNLFFAEQGGEQKFKSYFKLMVRTAVLLGANESVAEQELYDVILFEKNLYEIKPSDEGNFQFVNSVKDLPQSKYNISWYEMIVKAVGTPIEFSEIDLLYMMDPSYFERLEILLNDTPKKVVANYLAWSFVKTSLKYQPKRLAQLGIDYTNEVVGSVQNLDFRCLNDMWANLQHGLSALYVRMNYNPSLNDDVVTLFQNIKREFYMNLEKMDWMDEKTRTAAGKKVYAMSVNPPYTNKLVNDEIVDEYFKYLEVNPGSYFESFLNVSAFNRKRKFEDLQKMYNESSWLVVGNAFEANAAYGYYFNKMTIPAGFMKSPVYHQERPQYLNYGGAGSIIGHEITHGFDFIGRNYDESGLLNNWWEPETQNNFLNKVQCMIDQYSNFTLTQTGQSVNGYNTKNENIADNGGYKIAYYAYLSWARRNNVTEDCLASVNYTPRQLFWISAAKNWCASQSYDNLYSQVLTDEHSPAPARVIVSFFNMKEFAEDFQCKPGSRMNPEKKCTVW